MSTIKTINIAHMSATTPAIILNEDGSMEGSFPYPNRNLLYNGAMQVHQRGTSAAGVTSGGLYTADRWRLTSVGSPGTWTQSVENDGPIENGFSKSLRMLCTTSSSSLAANAALLIRQYLEGQDLQKILKGTTNAQELSLSFWVKSNVHNTYVVELVDVNNSRLVSSPYQVSVSGVWEKKVVKFPADSLGLLTNNNNASLQVNFWLAAGSNYLGGSLGTSWAGLVDANRAIGQTNLAAATNNYWQITGVQLEVGPVATEFEFKSFGQELAECQRYYYRIQPNAATKPLSVHGRSTSTTASQIVEKYAVQMRVSPTALEQSGTAGDYEISHGGSSAQCNGVPTYGVSTSDVYAVVNTTVASGLTSGNAALLRTHSGSTAGYLAWSAEL
jgi:hypothetical protein